MRTYLTFLVLMTAGIVQTQAVDPAPPAPAASEPAPAPPPPPTRTVSYELGERGEIPNWLTLGYLPGIQAAAVDRLAAVGGETNAQPYGGELVTFPPAAGSTQELALVWKMIEDQPPEVSWSHVSTPGVYLFVDTNGKAVENTVAYLYCGLESAVEQRLAIRFCGGEPIRVWFNGADVPVTGKLGNRCEWNLPPYPLEFKKGLNRLLVRLENRKDDEFLFARLNTETGGAVTNVTLTFRQTADMPMAGRKLLVQDWDRLVAEALPVPPSADADFFGANLGRTMTLLETGAQTRRPVRILFYGQSITESTWVWYLVRRLRERYPGADIQAENWAISGWGIDKLNRTIKHDILRARPDLVVLHAYNGGSWEWERILQKIRRETTAEIMIRTAHIDGGHLKNPRPDDDSETLLLRRLARTYGCELVECRKEWLHYMRTHGLSDRLDLCSDGLHLNQKGGILMAQLYERHFTPHPASRPWFQTVRRYEAMRALADRCDDEVRLSGDGWHDKDAYCATSTGTNDTLELTFYGNRVDLIMPQHNGKARILIDDKPLSEWNLFRGTRPGSRGPVPAWLMTYYMGTNMLEESWELKFTHLSGDYKKSRFTLTGSKTGPDGEGDNGTLFVSNSGRITIKPFPYNDLLPNWNIKDADKSKTELEPVTNDLAITWSVKRLYGDEVTGLPQQKGEPWKPRQDHPYRYVTIADGLPPGEHKLTLLPLPPKHPVGAFSIDAVEVHRPPLWPSSVSFISTKQKEGTK